MKAYVISICDERLESTRGRLANIGIKDVIHIEGVNASKGEVDFNSPDITLKCKMMCTARLVAIAMSHKRAVEAFLETTDEMAIIFEDDVFVADSLRDMNLLETIEHVIIPNVHNSEIDIVCLGCDVARCKCFTENNMNLFEYGFSKVITAMCSLSIGDGKWTGAHAYLVTRQGALKLIHHPIQYHIDVVMFGRKDINIKFVPLFHQLKDTHTNFLWKADVIRIGNWNVTSKAIVIIVLLVFIVSLFFGAKSLIIVCLFVLLILITVRSLSHPISFGSRKKSNIIN